MARLVADAEAHAHGDHAGEWVVACHAVAQAVYPDRHLLPAAWLLDTETLRSAHGGHRALADTVPAARRMIAIQKLWGRTNREHRDALAALLADLDRAKPPTSRERHSRKGIPTLAAES